MKSRYDKMRMTRDSSSTSYADAIIHRKEISAVTGPSTHGIEKRTKTHGLQMRAITVK